MASARRFCSRMPLCSQQNVGLIAMKALCGGLITNTPAAFAFFRQYDNVVPIWGLQHEHELDEFLKLESSPPELRGQVSVWPGHASPAQGDAGRLRAVRFGLQVRSILL